MPLSERFCDALVFANRLHATQTRKLSGDPFVGHLLRVAGIVLEHGADEDEAIAALLHDAIEDQGGAPTGRLIAERFGPRVAEIVAGCSDTDQFPKPPWRERKERYLAHLHEANSSIRLISAADKLDNVRSLTISYRALGEGVWARFQGGRDGTLWYFRSVLAILRETGNSLLVEQLALAVAELAARIAPRDQ